VPTPSLFKLVRAPDESVMLSVIVDDDGDPYPPRADASGGRFVWSLDTGAGFRRYTTPVQLSEFNVRPNSYRPGETVHLRVQYLDRVDLGATGGRDYSTCDPASLGNCELTPRSGCYQWVTWTVQYL
jgi:hypothetical protein